MAIQNILGVGPLTRGTGIQGGAGAQQDSPGGNAGVEGLKQTFSTMFDEVNSLQLQADKKIEQFATSPEKDIQGTMIALQKADISLRLMMQIRAKLTAAYQDIMRMQL
ncbi:MAG TPA: flagellar hook-basal body complex protein FliE [bacterium]|nr:flagellar hook-basal body complex protein FliE [bacterium]